MQYDFLEQHGGSNWRTFKSKSQSEVGFIATSFVLKWLRVYRKEKKNKMFDIKFYFLLMDEICHFMTHFHGSSNNQLKWSSIFENEV